MESNVRIIHEKWIAGDLEGSYQEQIELLPRQVLGKTENNYENLESELPKSRLEFEPNTFRIRSYGIVATPVVCRSVYFES
jgi:hypothetical protein